MDTMEMRRNAIAELVNKHGTVSFSQIKALYFLFPDYCQSQPAYCRI